MKIIKKFIQYLIPIIIAFALLGYAYRDLNLSALLAQVKTVKLSWIFLSLLLSLASHAVRAYRWKLLLQSLGLPLSLSKAFIALMIGYVSNLFVPRLGEVVRCSILKKNTGIPTSTSLGTVVAERAIDLVSLLAVLGFTLAISFTQLRSIFYDTVVTRINPMTLQLLAWGSLLVICLIGLLILVIRRKNTLETTWLYKVQLFLKGVWQGVNSLSGLDTKKTTLGLTLFMWLLYYLAGYVGVFAIKETANLDWIAGLSILAMSSISLTLPIQGGIGAYHLLVCSTLMAYGISKESGMLYVTLMHSAQLFVTFLVGGISLLMSSLAKKTHLDS